MNSWALQEKIEFWLKFEKNRTNIQENIGKVPKKAGHHFRTLKLGLFFSKMYLYGCAQVPLRYWPPSKVCFQKLFWVLLWPKMDCKLRWIDEDCMNFQHWVVCNKVFLSDNPPNSKRASRKTHIWLISFLKPLQQNLCKNNCLIHCLHNNFAWKYIYSYVAWILLWSEQVFQCCCPFVCIIAVLLWPGMGLYDFLFCYSVKIHFF